MGRSSCGTIVRFHFLVAEEDRGRYLKLMERTVPTGGFVIIATFGLDGPERCSGLDVRRYDPALLSGELGGDFELLEATFGPHPETVRRTPTRSASGLAPISW